MDQNGTERLCLQCWNDAGMTSTRTSWSLEGGSRLVDPDVITMIPNVAEYFAGVLVLLPGVLGNGRFGEYGSVRCVSGDDLSSSPFDITVDKLVSTGEYLVKK